MITLAKIIYDVRNIKFKGLAADDHNVSDRQITFWINKLRETLLMEMVDKGVVINDIFVQPINLELVCRDFSEENCLAEILGNSGITAMVSKPIPNIIPYRDHVSGRSIFTFFGKVNGESVHFVPWESVYYEQFRQYRTGSFGSFRDNKVYLFDANGIDLIQPRGLFQEPKEVANFNCGSSCFDYDSPYPITGKMAEIILKLIEENYLKYLLNPNVRQDTTNDARE